MKSESKEKLQSQFSLGFWTAIMINCLFRQLIGKERWLNYEASFWEWDFHWSVYFAVACALIFASKAQQKHFTK